MKHLSKILIVTMVLSLTLAVCVYAEETKTVETAAAVVAADPVPVEKTTLDNLQAAFDGESNAHAKYLAFAQKADAEGYGRVASLFRAAARAEQIHFERHAKVINEMGAIPTAKIETPVVKTTAENVKAAFDGETYESTIMYPEFLKKAEADQNKDAIDAFEDANAAEKVHAGLYKSVLDDMKAWKRGNKNFYVCPFCGNVVEKKDFKNCPICGEDPKQFLKVK